MAKRYLDDWSHNPFVTGEIGRLKVISKPRHVCAGDTVSINATSMVKLSPLRRPLSMDCRVDLFVFYVPHRHIYGDNWINFIKKGTDEDITFPSKTVGTKKNAYGLTTDNTVVPKWMIDGYYNIYNRYFKIPGDTDFSYDDTAHVTNQYGEITAWLPALWNGATFTTITDDDHKVDIASDKLDIIDLEKVKARYKTEVTRDWFGVRYNDILNRTWKSTVNIDADERPELLARESVWLSGYDVDGRDDATLGTFKGRAVGTAKLNMRPKYFAEHGGLFIMQVIRFPSIHQDETSWFEETPNPDYAGWSGDRHVIAKEPPIQHDITKYLGADSSHTHTQASLVTPYGQHYRAHPNLVDDIYKTIDGFPFVAPYINSKDRMLYVTPTWYNSMFQNTSLQHWQSSWSIAMGVKTYVPSPLDSVYAGSN